MLREEVGEEGEARERRAQRMAADFTVTFREPGSGQHGGLIRIFATQPSSVRGSGKCSYTKDDELRPDFSRVTFTGGGCCFLLFPEIHKSVNLPAPGPELQELLEKLRELFDATGVSHNFTRGSGLSPSAGQPNLASYGALQNIIYQQHLHQQPQDHAHQQKLASRLPPHMAATGPMMMMPRQHEPAGMIDGPERPPSPPPISRLNTSSDFPNIIPNRTRSMLPK
ncbi:hypothetical protein DIPPA_07589 [Diplonema papillatum]|nr:hypothetical protein DIPPA_07589 [Diplonema papillatum]